MDCTVCGNTDAFRTKVEYTDGQIEYLPLCPACLSEFDDAELVTEVSVDDARCP